MPAAAPLSLLIEIATARSDAARRALGGALAKSRTAAERLALLERYREEYRAWLTHSARRGLAAAELANFGAFLARLDAAIEQAAAQAHEQALRVTEERARWHAARNRARVFEALAARREATERADEARRERKHADEAAARFAATGPR